MAQDEIALKATSIVAPAVGAVGAVSAAAGDSISDGNVHNPVVTVDSGPLIVSARLPGTAIGEVRAGQPVALDIQPLQLRLPGQVVQVNQVASQSQTCGQLHRDLPDRRAGRSADGRHDGEHHAAMIRLRKVPAAAASAVLVATLATACSGPGIQPAPAPTPARSCPPASVGAENWIMGSGELSAAQSVSASSVRYAVSPAHLFVLLLRGQTSTAGQEVADFRSYAELKKMIRQQAIPAGIHWVMYDNEQWSLTPGQTSRPTRCATSSSSASWPTATGYKVILAPAQDLVPGFDKNSFRRGKAVWPSYLSMGLAAASARAADIYEIQAQPYEMTVYRSQHAYASFVAAAAAQARAANPGVVIYAGPVHATGERRRAAAPGLRGHPQPGGRLLAQHPAARPAGPARARGPVPPDHPGVRLGQRGGLRRDLSRPPHVQLRRAGAAAGRRRRSWPSSSSSPCPAAYDDSDQGRGTVVKLPPFGRQSLPRVGIFLVVAVAVGSLVVIDRHPALTELYHQALLRLLHWLIRDPSVVSAYARELVPLVPAAFVGYLVTAAIVMPRTVGRRLMILLHVPLFVAASLLTDCLLGVAVTALHVRPWPAPLISMYLQYFVGYLVVFRLFFTSHQLPKPTPVPRLRRGDLRDNVTLILCVVSATCVVFAVTLTLYRVIGVNTVLGSIVLIPVQLGVIDTLAIFLILVRRAGGRLPGPPAERPPLNVIIPAYNESVCIERQLWSIDRAAGRLRRPGPRDPVRRRVDRRHQGRSPRP